jgi:formylglycine-generating enzyme required for sulfatase activity
MAKSSKGAIVELPTAGSGGPAMNIMVPIEGATYLMGSDDSRDERPIHRVTIDGFRMDTTQVTQGDYEELMRVNPSFFQGDPMRPVENVTWWMPSSTATSGACATGSNLFTAIRAC